MAEVIRSRTNPLVKRLRGLKARAGHDAPCLLEGGKLVAEAVAAGVRLIEVAASPRARETAHGRAALDAAAAAGTEVRWLTQEILDSLSETETSQGLLALAERPRSSTTAALAGAAPLVLVAVEFQNPANLGALLRTAEAAGATGAVLTAGCADPFSWKALRGAMGSAFRLPLWHEAPLDEVVARVRDRGIRLAATDAAGDHAAWGADLRGPLALMMGNEARGLPDALVRAADLRLRIPLAGRVESLNVGVAAGILLFEAARQRRFAT